ncbi:potassium/proton antiporter, partial [Methanosalsum natronophilum]
NRKIDPKTSSTLEIESASNDPVAIILTVTMIGLILDTLDSASILILNLLWQILAGVLIGVIIGYLAPYLINRLKLESGGFYYVLALSLCFLSYGLADEIYANGFLAVFITGLIIGNREVIYKQGILRFLDGTSTFSQVLLFLMLGLLVTPSELVALWKEGVVVAIILIFVARPLAVLLCTIFWKYSIQQRLFLTWGGIKGAVPIVLATYPSAAGMEDGTFYFHIVFFVVLFSALVQGSTIDIVAKKLGLLTGMKNHPLHSMELLSLERSKSELLELEVLPENSIIDRKIQDLNLPPNCLITAIVRESEITTPRGQTKIKSGDILFVLTRYKDKDKLLEVLNFD